MATTRQKYTHMDIQLKYTMLGRIPDERQYDPSTC